MGQQVNRRDGFSPPSWLNGQTIAIVSTVLTVGVGIGAMVFASTSSIRGEIKGLDARLRIVERDVAVIKDRLTVGRLVPQGASPLDYEKDDTDA